LSFLDNFLPHIVGAFDVATGRASPAMLGLHEIQGVLPLSERHEILDAFGFRAGMNFMASPACTPLLLIDVDVVQVLVTVSEPGQRGCALIQHNGFFMAFEAERVGLDRKRAVELLRIGMLQNSEVFRSMRLVTTATIAVSNWAMTFRVILDPRFHIDDRPVRRVHRLVVAIEAKIDLGVGEDFRHVTPMRIVAVDALLFRGDGLVGDDGCVDDFTNGLMTIETQIRQVFFELEFDVTAMGIVTDDTTFFRNNLVLYAGIMDVVGHRRMAHEA